MSRRRTPDRPVRRAVRRADACPASPPGRSLRLILAGHRSSSRLSCNTREFVSFRSRTRSDGFRQRRGRSLAEFRTEEVCMIATVKCNHAQPVEFFDQWLIERTGWGGVRLPLLANSSTEPGESPEARLPPNASHPAARGAWHWSLHSSPTNGPESEKGYRME